jgi:hypothetical protein
MLGLDLLVLCTKWPPAIKAQVSTSLFKTSVQETTANEVLSRES